MIEFKDGEMRLTNERVSAQLVFVDGSGVGDVDPEVMREREALSQDGIVLVNLTMTKEFNAVVYEPDITTRGFILPREGDELLSTARREIIQAAGRANGNVRRVVEDTVRDFIYRETRRRPMVFVNINRVV